MSDSDNDRPREEESAKDSTESESASPSEEQASAAGDGEDEAKAKAEAAAKAKAAAEAKAAKAKALAEAEAAKDPWERDPATPTWEDAASLPIVEALGASHPQAILSAQTFAGDLVLEIEASAIRDVCQSLKQEHGYTLLVDMCGAHFDKREEKRLEVVYIFHNLQTNEQIRLKVKLDEGGEVPSVTPVYAGANWTEREAYDMYGIRFSDHPDMTRILLWEGFNGHPLLKDFPVEGIDTGAAIYPETYSDTAGPIAGTGTGWKPPAPAEPEEQSEPTAPADGDEGSTEEA